MDRDTSASMDAGVVHQVSRVPNLVMRRKLLHGPPMDGAVRMVHGEWELELDPMAVPSVWDDVVAALERGLGLSVLAEEVGEADGEGVLGDGDLRVHAMASPRHATAFAYGRDVSLGRRAIDAIEDVLRRAHQPSDAAEEPLVAMRFWFLGSDGESMSYVRAVPCESMEDVAGNYAERNALTWLASLERPWQKGKFVLWRGESGTGKTHAASALVRAWRGCAPEVVTDPEAFLSKPEYLNYVLLHRPGNAMRSFRGETRHSAEGRLIVLEDLPDLANDEDGGELRHALSKLLNATDGLVGQDLPIVFLVTSSELHGDPPPALVRPGRLLQRLDFEPFEPEAAADWLRTHGVEPPAEIGRPTLAELYAFLRDGTPLGSRGARMGFAVREG